MERDGLGVITPGKRRKIKNPEIGIDAYMVEVGRVLFEFDGEKIAEFERYASDIHANDYTNCERVVSRIYGDVVERKTRGKIFITDVEYRHVYRITQKRDHILGWMNGNSRAAFLKADICEIIAGIEITKRESRRDALWLRNKRRGVAYDIYRSSFTHTADVPNIEPLWIIYALSASCETMPKVIRALIFETLTGRQPTHDEDEYAEKDKRVINPFKFTLVL